MPELAGFASAICNTELAHQQKRERNEINMSVGTELNLSSGSPARPVNLDLSHVCVFTILMVRNDGDLDEMCTEHLSETPQPTQSDSIFDRIIAAP